MKKGGKFYSIIHQKCPRCHQGNMFEFKNSYRFKDITSMYEKCTKCGLKYEKEPGFFYGAMYVSYALTVALWVTLAVIIFPFFNISPWLFLGIGVSALFLLLPIIYRLSRAIWLNIFIKYEPENGEM